MDTIQFSHLQFFFHFSLLPILASVGDAETERLLKYTACPMDCERSKKLLKALPTHVTSMVAEGCGNFAVTRKELLMDVVNSL